MHRATLLVVALAGCSGGIVTPGSSELEITTDKTQYTAAYVQGEGTYREFAFTTRVRIENIGTGTTFLELCSPDDRNPIFGVQMLGAAPPHGSGYNPTWACTGHGKAIRIDPGEVRTYTLQVAGPNGWDGRTGEVFGALEGEMRLFFHVGCSMSGPCDTGRASNPFTVVLGDS